MEKIKTTLTKIVNNKDTYKALFGLAVLFVAYQAFVVVPQKQAETKAYAEYLEQAMKQKNYKACDDSAYSDYDATWENYCKALNRATGCGLPQQIAQGLDDSLEEAKDRCVTLYK